MTEKPDEQEGEAERKIRQIFKEELAKTANQASKPQSTASTPDGNSPAQTGTEHKHFTAEEAMNAWEHVQNCPNCTPKLEKLVNEREIAHYKNEQKRRMNNKYGCATCGTKLSQEEFDKGDCPICDGKKADLLR